ncbi:hypothetical protein CGJ10_22930 [Vibrio parahaemolyticus]|nr:hypothetical protein CGJ10_22930 [Vibrio parahaemolyticus]
MFTAQWFRLGGSVAHYLTRRYTLYEESLKFRSIISVFSVVFWGLGIRIPRFQFSFSPVRGSVLAYRLSVVFFFGSDCFGSVQAAFFADIQLCDFAFLKADLLAERALSLAW